MKRPATTGAQKLVTTSFSVSVDLKQRLEDIAWERRASVSEVLREALQEYVDKHPEVVPA